MTKKVKLDATPDQFHGLHLAIQSRGATVRVDKEALRVLLQDHSRLMNHIGLRDLEGST